MPYKTLANYLYRLLSFLVRGKDVGLGSVLTLLFVGVLFYLSKWYTKKELNLRMSIFYSGSLLAGAFGNLIAGGILNGLDGAKGMRAWRWLYIVEGVSVSQSAPHDYMYKLTFSQSHHCHWHRRYLHPSGLPRNLEEALSRAEVGCQSTYGS